MTSRVAHLDHAAGTPLCKESSRAVQAFLKEPIYNPDASYQDATELRRHLADLKKKTAKILGTNSPNIIITSGSSDANNKLLELINLAEPNGQVLTSNLEHQTLLSAIKRMDHIIVDGSKVEDVLNNIKNNHSATTSLVTVQYVNNETGQVMPIKQIAELINQIRQTRVEQGSKVPIFLHTDASQAATTQDIHLSRLGVDAMSLNGSKFGALPATGLLYLSSDLLRHLASKNVTLPTSKVSPLNITSLYPALQKAIQKKNSETKRLLSLGKAFLLELQALIPDIKLNPADLKIGKNHSPHILNILIPGVSAEKLVILAGINGINIGTGAACSANKDRPSHVLQALGLSAEEINSSIRVSFGSSNQSESEVKGAAKKLAELCSHSSVKKP